MEGLCYWGVWYRRIWYGAVGVQRVRTVMVGGCSIRVRENDTGVQRGLAGVQGWGALGGTVRMAGSTMGPGTTGPAHTTPATPT